MRKKTICWGLGSLLLAMVSILWIAPAFIDSSFLKQKIQAEIRRQNAGELDYRSAKLAFFPSLRLTIRDIEFSAPDAARAIADRILIYPKILPLFRGRLRLSKMVVHAPVFTLDISDEYPVNGDSGEAPGPFSPSEWVADAMGPLAAYASGLKVEIDRGKVQINRDGRENLFIKDLDLDAGLTVAASGSFNAQLSIGPVMIIVSRKDRQVTIDCDRLQAALHVDENQAHFTLDELQLKQPAMALSGRFVASPDASGFSLDLSGKDLDVQAVREAALGLVGENELVGDIFAYVEGGRIPAIRIQSSGKTLAELGDLENIVIEGRMRNGDIAIDDIGLVLAGVNGEGVISKGMLEASGVSAAVGKIRGHDGSLKLGLAEDDYTFHLDVAIDAELNPLPSVLKNIVDHEEFIAELSLISDVNGKGRGRLILGDRIDDIHTRLEVYEMNFTAAYQRLPFPVHVNGGRLFLEDIFIRVEDIDGSVGSSVFSGVAGKVEWENRLHVDIPDGRLDLDLKEFYPWVSSIAALGEDLADVKDVNGRLRLSGFTLTGPDDDNDPSGQWQMSAAGEADNVTIDSSRLGETLYLSSGSIQVSPQNRISFQNLKARWLDASLDLTGTLEGDFKNPHQAEVSINGQLGENVMAVFCERGRLPKDYAVQTPVKLTHTDILWRSGRDVSFKGNLFFPEGVRITTDIYHQPGELTVHRLDIKDEDSAVACAFGLKKDRINLAFKGSLESRTLHRILASEKMPDGWLKGDMAVSFVKDNLSEAILKGRLEGGNFTAPTGDNPPLFVETFQVAAEKNIIKVDHVALSYLENRVTLTGHGELTAEALMLKLDAAAGDMKWAFSDKQSGEATENNVDDPEIALWGYPVHVDINLSAESFSMGQYVWRPVHAGVSWGQGKVRIEVMEADLCGIDTPGTLLLDGDNLYLDFQFSARDREFIASYECLSKNRIEMTGSYDLFGQINASGPVDALLDSATGSFDFTARNGVITQSKTLSRILEVVNFTEIVKGKIPDLSSEGFSYETINVQGDLGTDLANNNRVMLTKIYMDGKTLDLLGQGTLDLASDRLNVELLAAPFKTVDAAIKQIPGVNYLMAGTLISIPIRIRGEMADPKVRVMKASDISSHFLDFAERTIKSPVRLIQHWNPYHKPDAE
jgi:uncharacterized protein involved in outer membrane biogenesis